MMDIREEFEAYIRAKAETPGDGNFMVERNYAGDYAAISVQGAWLGYQAGRQAGALAMRERAAKRAEDCDYTHHAAKEIRALPVEE